MTKNGITDWLRQNAWAIILFTGLTVAGYSALNARVDAMEAKLATYPSQDYFELKFQTIDQAISDLTKAVSKEK